MAVITEDSFVTLTAVGVVSPTVKIIDEGVLEIDAVELMTEICPVSSDVFVPATVKLCALQVELLGVNVI